MQEEKVPVFSWIFTFIVLAIPLVNVIYFIALLFGGSKYDSKVSFIRATFVFSLIALAILLLLGILAFGGIQDLINKVMEYIQQVIDAIKNGNIVVI